MFDVLGPGAWLPIGKPKFREIHVCDREHTRTRSTEEKMWLLTMIVKWSGYHQGSHYLNFRVLSPQALKMLMEHFPGRLLIPHFYVWGAKAFFKSEFSSISSQLWSFSPGATTTPPPPPKKKLWLGDCTLQIWNPYRSRWKVKYRRHLQKYDHFILQCYYPQKKFTWLGDYKHLQFWIPHSSGLKVDVEDIFKSMIILSWCYYPEKIKKHMVGWL